MHLVSLPNIKYDICTVYQRILVGKNDRAQANVANVANEMSFSGLWQKT